MIRGASIAQTLELREAGERPPLQCLLDHLHSRQLLLLLDNFEQVAAAAPLLARLLSACPALRVLVTSRAALRIQGEHEFPVPPLALAPCAMASVPTPGSAGADLLDYAAAALFVQRAQAVRPGFQADGSNAPLSVR